MVIPGQLELTSIFLILVGLIEQKRGKAKETVLFKKTENETRTLLFADERNWKQKKPVPIVIESSKKRECFAPKGNFTDNLCGDFRRVLSVIYFLI